MIVLSDNPMEVEEVFEFTGKDALMRIGDYNCRIMNFSAGQKIEVVDVVECRGKTFGIKEMINKKPNYQYLAFLCKQED
jgi:hypothetical protein